MFNVLGLDVGHSMVKMSFFDGVSIKRASFKSVVAKGFDITGEAEKKAAERDTVLVGDELFFVGRTAELQGGEQVLLGMNDEWIYTPIHTALIKGAMRIVDDSGMPRDNRMVVTGLPMRLFNQQKHAMQKIIEDVIGCRAVVIPQPYGPYSDVMFLDSGLPNTSRPIRQQHWAVIDVGHYTTDMLLVREGLVIEKQQDSCGGVRLAAESLERELRNRGIQADFFDCLAALQSGRIKNFGKETDVSREVANAKAAVVLEIEEKATKLFGSIARKLDGIILGGGGVSLVADVLKKKWPNIVVAENPRYAIAEGMRKWGSFLRLKAGRAVVI